jgi:PatG C-terminal
MQMADNAGATDEHRALNYCVVRYQAIYGLVADAHQRDCSLTAVDVRESRLSGVRRIVDVIFSFTHRNTDVTEKHYGVAPVS